MSKDYRANNKRIIKRAPNGKFRRATLLDIGLIERELEFAICSECGYGENSRDWRPLLDDSPCPDCKCKDKDDEKVINLKLQDLINHWNHLPDEAKSLIIKCFDYTATSFPHPESIKKYEKALSELREFRIYPEIIQMVSKGQREQFYKIFINQDF